MLPEMKKTEEGQTLEEDQEFAFGYISFGSSYWNPNYLQFLKHFMLFLFVRVVCQKQ